MAAISERGSDAAGYCFRGPGLELQVHKRRAGASELLDESRSPTGATQVLVHVRDYTKGHPSLNANNHPVRHGSVVGSTTGSSRTTRRSSPATASSAAEHEMTVDSEAIFALAEQERSRATRLEELYGSMATAWLDERDPDVVFLARGIGRPLWVGEGEQELFFASTRERARARRALQRPSAPQAGAARGTLLAAVRAGGPERGLQPDRSFTEAASPGCARAPEERQFCLARLAALATAAAGR